MTTWASYPQGLPKYSQRVFATHDLKPLGRGKFVGDYYYTKYGFVATGYGYGYGQHHPLGFF